MSLMGEPLFALELGDTGLYMSGVDVRHDALPALAPVFSRRRASALLFTEKEVDASELFWRALGLGVKREASE